MKRVPDKIDFSKEEDRINELWQKSEVFRSSVKQSFTKQKFTFFDGPPFATGLPHYGHVLAGTVKDIVTRFAHQSGHHVGRRFGWDCHGLPVEFEIDKLLKITGPNDVMKMGIDKYNAECRKIVMRYSYEWEVIMGRLARWVDFEYDYKTLYPWYMESIWFVFHELYVKGLVYKGVKVMPYSTACNTPLSNFESGQNYKDVVDPQVTIGFPLVSDPNVMLIAWTTTPWTLPSNLCLCVHPELTYVKVKSLKKQEVYILMEARLSMVFKKENEYQVLEKFPGEKLRGLRYEPLFPYFKHLSSTGAFQVLVDKYVTEDAGTGVVHQAPYFGEDDYRICLAAGVISRDQDIVCPIDASGRFVMPVADFLNDHVKDADKKIIKYMKEKCPRRLIDASTVKHSYPFCWRSETPLIYRAVPSWFVRVEHMIERLLESSQATYWVPDFVKEKRFGNWLRGARDWAISRNRYWGTPIPLWISEDGKEVVCVGSIKQLEELTGQKISDLHRESIDNLTIPSVRPGMPPLRRVPEVFDCWFESGSMPYAQLHFPFTRDSEIAFHKGFPADFIAEGIDQTRGWFYTLLVISTALFNKAPYKNLIAHGLVLASDGQKMSKRKKNYPDPMEVVGKYGADALRLYLINSPVVRADNLRFKEEGVRDVLKDVLLPWYNAYRYLAQSIERLTAEEKLVYEYDSNQDYVATNTMDRWIKSTTQTMVTTVWTEMAQFHLYKVVPTLVDYIDQLTNWYIRMNRKRLKGDNGVQDCLNSLNTLFGVLFTFVRIMAPFTPYLCELMYGNLRQQLSSSSQDKTAESVHYLNLPKPVTSDIDPVIERRIKSMQYIISAGRIVRDKRTVPMKYPLPEVIVISRDKQYIEDVGAIESYILEELNLKKLVLSSDCDKHKVALVADVDHKALGSRLKGDFKTVLQAVKELSDTKVQEFLKKGQMEVLGHTLTTEDVFISYRFADGSYDMEKYETVGSKEVALMFDMKRDAAMLDEGLAREVVNLVQKLRKKGQLVPTDSVTVYYKITPEDSELSTVVSSQSSYIENLLKAPIRPWIALNINNEFVVEEVSQLKGTPGTVQLRIVRGFASDWGASGGRGGSIESIKRKNTTPSTQAAKVVKSDASHEALEKEKKNEIKGKSPNKEIKNKHPKSELSVVNNRSCMLPLVRHLLVKVHKSVPVNVGSLLVLLENPSNKNEIAMVDFKNHVIDQLGLRSHDLSFYLLVDGSNTEKLDNSNKPMSCKKFNKKVIYIYNSNVQVERTENDFLIENADIPDQPFINVEYKGEKGVVFVKGQSAQSLITDVAHLFKLESERVKLFRTVNGPKNNLTVQLE